MKNLIILIAASLLSIICDAQSFTVDAVSIDDNVTRVYETKSNTATQKHLLAKEWVAKNFGDYKSVLQFEDDEKCKIIVKGYSKMSDNSKLSYTLTIDSKDDKYRVTVEDLEIKDYVVQVSRVLKADESTKQLLNSMGVDEKHYCDIEYQYYVDVDAKIQHNIEMIESYKKEIESTVQQIAKLEQARTIIDYSKKPKGMTKSLYRQRIREGYYKDVTVEQLNENKSSAERSIRRANAEISEYKQRIVDVETALFGLLQSLFKKLDTSDDF